MGRIKKNRASQAPLFVKKLFQLIEVNTHIIQDNQTQQIISWTTTADSFIIKSVSKFTEEVLPVYWKHRNFSSFIRQLNMYGFKKTRHTDGENVYFNQDFRARGRQLLKNIERKTAEDKQEVVISYSGSCLRNEGVTVKQINELKVRQRKLEEVCRQFLIENQRLMEENKNLVRKMEKQSSRKEQRLEQFLFCLVTQNRTTQIGAHDSTQKLSLTNEQYEGSCRRVGNSEDNQGIEVEESTHVKRVKQLLQQIYCRRNEINNNNMRMQISKDGEYECSLQEDMRKDYLQILDEQPKIQQFLSINDFLNVQDEEIDFSAAF